MIAKQGSMGKGRYGRAAFGCELREIEIDRRFHGTVSFCGQWGNDTLHACRIEAGLKSDRENLQPSRGRRLFSHADQRPRKNVSKVEGGCKECFLGNSQ